MVSYTVVAVNGRGSSLSLNVLVARRRITIEDCRWVFGLGWAALLAICFFINANFTSFSGKVIDLSHVNTMLVKGVGGCRSQKIGGIGTVLVSVITWPFLSRSRWN